LRNLQGTAAQKENTAILVKAYSIMYCWCSDLFIFNYKL